MALRSARTHIVSILLLVFVLALFPGPVQAGNGVKLPPLEEFAAVVSNGESHTLRGLYVPDVLAGRVVPQPVDEPGFVSNEENTLTLFDQAARVGSTGLLAHNFLAGKNFSHLKKDSVFYLVYGDGHTEPIIVTEIVRYKALNPESIWSDFIDLQRGTPLSASGLFSEIYEKKGAVILQTCITLGGEASWGRLFVIAEPYEVMDKEPAIHLTSYKQNKR